MRPVRAESPGPTASAPLRIAAALVLVGVQLLAGGALSAPAHADVAVPEGALRLDGIAAVVGGLAPGSQVISIFRSDVELRARLALLRAASFLPSHAAEPGASTREALAALPSGLLRASLDELVGEALIAVEAARLNLERPSARELAEERARLLGARGDAASVRELLAALGVGERELAEWIARRAVVNGFLQANLEGTLEISNDELVQRFETEQHPFQGQSLDQVHEQFSAWLAQQRMQQAVERWVQSLAQRTPHRILAAY